MSDTVHARPPRVVLGRWHEWLLRARPRLDRIKLGPLLALDPGETTGWAVFVEGQLDACGQWQTLEPDQMFDEIMVLFGEDYPERPPSMIVYEEYRVRGNKFKEHVGSEVVTIQNIGAIKTAAAQLGVPTWKQTPGQAKGFATDRKLRQWGLYQTNQRHANDAIRHAVYFTLFVDGREQPERHGHP